MKNTLLLALLILFTNSTFAQNDTTFNRVYYKSSGSTMYPSILEHNDYYFACIVKVDTPSLQQCFGIKKIDKNGIIVDSSMWCISNRDVAINSGHSFTVTKDNKFLIASVSLDYGGEVLGLLTKVDENLDTLWTRWFHHPDTAIADTINPSKINLSLSDVKQALDGNYIITGNYNKDCNGHKNRSFLMKTDTSGNIIWFRLMNSNIIPSNVLYDIENDPVDSGFYFPSGRSVTSPQLISLFKTDKQGNVLWYTQVNHTPPPNYQQHPVDAEVINDSTVIVVSAKQWLSNPYGLSVVVASVNTITHSLNWEKNYSFDNAMKDPPTFQSIGANLSYGKNIAISSTMFIDDPKVHNGYRGTILLINQNGDSLWQRYYAHEPTDSFDIQFHLTDLIPTKDGGFLFGGAYDDLYEIWQHAWLVKTDSMGYAPATYTLAIEEEQLLIKVVQPKLYPNPAVNDINLRFEESPNESIELSIYSSTGAIVKQQLLTAHSNEYRIDIQDLRTGAYIVKLATDNRIIYSSKFIKK